MELFHDDGHLTDEGLRAVVDGTLDELGRLEASEHLSFCDGCLLRYTALLADDALLAPPAPIAPSVFERIRRRTVRVFVNRYTRVAAAAVLALALWGTGIFSSLVPAPELMRPQAPRHAEAPVCASARMNGFFRDAGESISAAFSQLLRLPADGAAQ